MTKNGILLSALHQHAGPQMTQRRGREEDKPEPEPEPEIELRQTETEGSTRSKTRIPHAIQNN